jgi:hypothetical protein
MQSHASLYFGDLRLTNATFAFQGRIISTSISAVQQRTAYRFSQPEATVVGLLGIFYRKRHHHHI